MMLHAMPHAADLHAAAETLLFIAETTSGERRRRTAAVAVVLRALERCVDGADGREFLRRRAEREIAALRDGEAALLTRLLLTGPEAEGDAPLVDALVDYAYQLETTRRLPEADAVLRLARAVAPGSATVALHAGRVARRQGDRVRALELYRTARSLDAAGGAIARLARIGEAVVSADAEARLGEVARAARAAGDGEAVGVALEERARIRRARGARRRAALDLCRAVLRFPDPVDRARVAHQLADLYVAEGDLPAAREALLLALALGERSQRDHARGRLHAVSRDLGDRVGMRRWRPYSPPPLISLGSRPRTPRECSDAGRLALWRERLVAAPA